MDVMVVYREGRDLSAKEEDRNRVFPKYKEERVILE
jgi:hypothetical protein